MNYNYFILPFFLLMAQMSVAQNLSGNELLEKSIQYHDPSDNWSTWKPEFTLKFDAKNRPARISTVEFNNKNNRFHLTVDQEGRTVERIIKKRGVHQFIGWQNDYRHRTYQKISPELRSYDNVQKLLYLSLRFAHEAQRRRHHYT